jgi:hypothetical protein
MYKKVNFSKSSVSVRSVERGETIEERLARRMLAGEELESIVNEGGARSPLNYSEAGDGVSAETDIRTDRFEVALDAMTANSKRKNVAKSADMKVVKDESDNSEDVA